MTIRSLPARSVRVDILIPTYYNDGSEVQDEIFTFVHDRLIKRFKAYTKSPQKEEGFWVNKKGELIRDELVGVWVVCPYTINNRLFFKHLKKKLEVILKQDSIFVTLTHNVEIL